MRVDTSASVYRESDQAETEFSPVELRRARFLMRRLQFLEAKVRNEDAVSGGAVFAEMEIEALEWALGPEGLDYLIVER